MTGTAKRAELIKRLFNDALELPPSERASFLAEICGGDNKLQREIETLLDSDTRSEEFLSEPVFNLSAVQITRHLIEENPAAIGSKIGVYRFLEELGRGGMGTVFLAERSSAASQQKVAVKLLRHTAEMNEINRRFQTERQILAALEHPFIARLIDGGTSDDGLPYFVMEYVAGVPIDRYCDEQNLTLEERLKLFRKICSAVEYAHAHAVIHRDIKPSNILVTKDGTPKLLDFGIAKVLRQNNSTAKTETTVTAFRMMTLDYASPEQMRGGRIGYAADVYSLGVLLYKLLTGKRPYLLDGKSPYEIVRTICEEEPLPPSSAVRGAVDVEFKRLKSDLDKVVMMALRKDPERRYASVELFSADVERCELGVPVHARQTDFVYYGSKFLGRHRFAALSTCIFAFALLLIGFSSNWIGDREYRKTIFTGEKIDELRRNPADDRRRGGTASEEARNLYFRAQALWEQRNPLAFNQAAELFHQATVKDTEFALAYSGLANSYFLLCVWGYLLPDEAFPKAKTAALKAIEVAPEAAEGHLSVAMIHWLYEYDWDSADREFKRAVELSSNYARAPQWYGLFLAEMGRFDEAVAMSKRALAIEPESIPVNADFARVLYYARRYDESLEQYRKTMAMNPTHHPFYYELLYLYEALGMSDEWCETMDKTGAMVDSKLREACSTGGIYGYWAKVSEFTTEVDAVNGAVYYNYAEQFARTGKTNRALEFLDKAYRARSHRMAQLKVNPIFDNLRSDIRFKELLRRMNLEK
jgi:serine/threonine protein kinase/tetratricopeptide (TPR) repeat protein